MITIKPDNVQKHLCVICDKFIDRGSYWQCKKCNKVCQITMTDIEKPKLEDIKSACCDADVNNHQNITCGDDCHSKFVEKMLVEFGDYKKITDESSGISYKVPTKQIVEEGITQKQLKDFPVWVD
jgi:hypothetical protein